MRVWACEDDSTGTINVGYHSQGLLFYFWCLLKLFLFTNIGKLDPVIKTVTPARKYLPLNIQHTVT